MGFSTNGVYKINYDGAVFSEVNKSGIGVVIRDSSGQVIAALVQQLSQAYQAVKVVAMAASKALEFGNEIGIDKEIVERDSDTVVKALGNLDKGLSSYGLLINDEGLFSVPSYSHTRRDGNRHAHSLARLVITMSVCTVWMKDVPPYTLYFIQADLVDLS
ncbi:uncharacterized protein LOC115962976 [Quercus lobata]|uniref:uncharacterized protein LOC115962976 n=1 Tax=Quercus lobata TaxID=97700 RepID=UPI00124697C3|nr:uncharacterized protein LOC115962976 [Quercus lobata]